MQVGDSFFMKSAYPEHERGRVSAAACAYAKKHGVKFSTKIFDNGVRTWRIK
jgi:rhodanese-related sulfurtransferase